MTVLPTDQYGATTEQLIDFPTLFRQQVEKSPNQLAIVFEHHRWTYAELDAASDQVAVELLRSPSAAEDRIGICLDRSIDAVVAMLAILKSGMAFVPLDPEFPPDRLAYIVADSSIRRIIGDLRYQNLFAHESPGTPATYLDIESLRRDDQTVGQGTSPPLVDIAPQQLAYIMYTSGSTGNPKGVQIEHGSLAAYCYADIEVYRLIESDRTLQFSTLNFDIAIEEIFPPLMMGSCVVIRPRDRADAQNELSSIVEKHDVTAIHLATAYWHEWVDLMVASQARVPASLRLMVVTGEKVSAQHFQRWLTLCDQEVLWCNAYGPTEATVTSTVFVPPTGWQGANLPIGKPLPGYDAWILDKNLQPIDVPVNRDEESETGELYIGGPALARGYLNLPEQTAKAFVTIDVQGEATRLYKTGDLARWSFTGDIEFGGRIDHQIKLGSYRIEPAEIEAAINQHPHVLEALVSYDEIEGKKYLIAYVASGTHTLNPAELADHLRDLLPTYMIPPRYLFLESFPKTINGKIDRRALPDASQSKVIRRTDYVEAETDLERQLVDIWSGVLNVPEVGVHDDFFELGGSSLLVTRVITEISSQLNFEVPVRDFFANPTVACIAGHLTALHTGSENTQSKEAARRLRDSLPQIETQFVDSDNESIYTVYYPPVESRRKTNTEYAVVISSPYGHEYQRAYRNVQQLALHLSRRGAHVIRFDYVGTGNSTGDDLDFSPRRSAEDLATVCEYLERRTGIAKQTLVGVRLGATLAAASHLPASISNIVLWDPVLEGTNFVELLEQFYAYTTTGFRRFQCRKRNPMSPQGYGHQLPPQLREQLGQLKVAESSLANKQVSAILSDQYQLQEPNWKLPTSWRVEPTTDEIYWQDPQFAESAFSSPEVFKAIAEKITQSQVAS